MRRYRPPVSTPYCCLFVNFAVKQAGDMPRGKLISLKDPKRQKNGKGL